MTQRRTAAKRPVPRPAGTTPLNINLPDELMEALTSWVDTLNEQSVGARWTRTDVVRTALTRAVEERGKKGETP